jgi:hypothetical protein
LPSSPIVRGGWRFGHFMPEQNMNIFVFGQEVKGSGSAKMQA